MKKKGMKKEGIAIYGGFSLFIVTFLVSAILGSTGHKHQSQIGIALCLMLLGATMLAGIYSNVKNYGYIWTNVRQRDSNLSFEELDEKYARVEKGTWQYRLVTGCMALVALSLVTGGVVMLVRNM